MQHDRPEAKISADAEAPAAVERLERVKRLARTIRHLPDRLAHGWRRRRARRLLRARSPRRVLVVCLGNICRSPYAAGLLGAALRGSDSAVQSAGFIGPGRPAPPLAVRLAAERGLDLGAHVSQRLDASLVEWADVVVVMDPAQRRALRREYGRVPVVLLGDLDPEPITTRTVRDPYEQSERVYREVFARIERCTDALVRTVRDSSAR